jgi:hypothetical protein
LGHKGQEGRAKIDYLRENVLVDTRRIGGQSIKREDAGRLLSGASLRASAPGQYAKSARPC